MGSAHLPLLAHGKNRGSQSRQIPAGRWWAAREGRASVLARAAGKPIGGLDREGAHRSLAHDSDGNQRRGAPVRGRRSGENPELKRCHCTPGRSGACEGRDRAGRWPERPVVGERVEERRWRGTGDGNTGKWLRLLVVRAMSTTG
jgi:hypothetical protein